MLRFIPLFYLLALGQLAGAQSTVFELFSLPEAGCDLSEPGAAAAVQSRSAVAEAPPPPPPTPPTVETASLAQLRNFVKQQVAENQMLDKRVAWGDYTFVHTDGRWALFSSDGEVLIPPTFDAISTKNTWRGFVGYQGLQANYYDAAGNAQFPDTYLGIEPIQRQLFKVQTEAGMGLIDSVGNVILAPEYERVELLDEGKHPYAWAQPWSELGSQQMIQHLTSGQRTYLKAFPHNFRFVNKRYAIVFDRFLLDLEQGRSVFCSNDLHVRYTYEEDYLVISRNGNQSEYLINLDGDLITTQPFVNIYQLGNGVGFKVGLPDGYQAGHGHRNSIGIIDFAGNWLVRPRYRSIYVPKEAPGYYMGYQFDSENSAVFNLAGEELLPAYHYRSVRLSANGDTLSAEVYPKDGGRPYELQYHLPTKKYSENRDLPYWQRSHFKGCGEDSVFMAKNQLGEVLINKAGEIIIPPQARIFLGPGPGRFNTLSSKVPGTYKYYRRWYDCQGNAFTFDIDGEAVDSFLTTFSMGDGSYFVQTDLEGGFVILKDHPLQYSDIPWAAYHGRLGSGYNVRNSLDQYGIITENGTTLLPPTFYSLGIDHYHGLLKFGQEEGKIQYLQSDGSVLFDGRYSDVRPLAHANAFRVKQNGRWGVVTVEGTELLPLRYKYIKQQNGWLQAGTPSGEKHYYNLAGKHIR